MEWIGPTILGCAVVALLLQRFLKRRRRDIGEAVVQFDLAMPEKWAAELAQNVLEGEGNRTELGRDGDEWICRVTVSEGLDGQGRETLRAHFDQIASSRGGECRRFHIVRGEESVTYETTARSRLA